MQSFKNKKELKQKEKKMDLKKRADASGRTDAVKKDEKEYGKEKKKKETVGKSDVKKTESDDIPVRRAEKTPKQKKEERRFFCVIVMALCVLFLSGWSVCQAVKNVNTGNRAISLAGLPGETVEDNSKNDGKELDIDALIKKILNNVAFDVELEKLDASVADGMISATEGTELRIYMGNGTHADELVVMTAMNEEDAKVNQKNVQSHLDEMKKQFSDYIPEEVKKIENAVQVRCGCYVIVCITSDTDTAKSTIDAFIKQ